MPATKLALTGSLRVEQGATFTLTALLADQYGQPFNLTGYSVASQIRHNYTDAIPSASFTCSIDSPATSGSLTISLPASASMGLTSCVYKYDLEITSGSQVVRVFEGPVEVSPNVTR